MPFLLWHFSSGDEIENCPAQISRGPLDCNTLLLGQHNLDNIGEGTVL